MEKEYWVKFGAFVFVLLCLAAGLSASITMAVINKEMVLTAFIIWALCICGMAATVRLWLKYLVSDVRGKDPKPIVQIWTHNDETIVTPDEVYRSSLVLRDKFRVIYPWISPSFRVRPLIYSVQSAKRKKVVGITPAQLQAIRDSCSVSVSEMQIPSEGDIGHMVDFEQMWKLLHGVDSEPPKV